MRLRYIHDPVQKLSVSDAIEFKMVDMTVNSFYYVAAFILIWMIICQIGERNKGECSVSRLGLKVIYLFLIETKEMSNFVKYCLAYLNL